MVFNDTFNNISVISRWSVLLLLEETGVSRKNRPAASHRQILSHKVVHLAMSGIQIHKFCPFYFLFDHCVVCPSSIYESDYPFGIFKLFLVMIWIGCVCGCKSNYHTIMIATAPQSIIKSCSTHEARLPESVHMDYHYRSIT
jgi:hypothetical protein